MDGQDYEEERGIGQSADTSARPSGNSYTSQPERDLQPGDPNLAGAAPPAEKKGMAEKVKGMFGGMKKGHHDDSDSSIGSGVGHTPESSPYGTGQFPYGTNVGDGQTGHSLDPTAGAGYTSESSPYGVGQSPYGTKTGDGQTGHSLDPTAGAGHTSESSPYGVGQSPYGTKVGDGQTDHSLDPTVGAGHTSESSPYDIGQSPYGTNDAHTDQSLDPTAGNFTNENAPQATNPQGVTNDQGGAALTDERGNLKPGPAQDAVKREGIFSKIKDKMHGSK